MIYLDNAATTYPKPEEVYSFADKFYRENGVYAGRGSYLASQKVNNLIRETRELLLELFNAPNEYITIFSPSATIALNTIISGLVFHSNDNIYHSHFEHNAVLRPLEHITNNLKVNIFKLSANKHDLCYNMDNILKQFTENKPRAVIVSHAGNVLGNVAPIEKIFELAKNYGATTILDASQTAGLLNIDLTKIKADFVVFAGHKTLYAPFGIAGLVMKKEIKLRPFIFGGTGKVSAEKVMPKFYPERLEAGSFDIYAIAGLNASLRWIKRIGINNIYKKEMDLLDFTISELSSLNNIKLYLPKCDRIPIVSFNVKGYSPNEVDTILSQNNIAVRAGLHCAPKSHDFIGTSPSGTIRIGLNFFNKKEDSIVLKEIIKDL